GQISRLGAERARTRPARLLGAGRERAAGGRLHGGHHLLRPLARRLERERHAPQLPPGELMRALRPPSGTVRALLAGLGAAALLLPAASPAAEPPAAAPTGQAGETTSTPAPAPGSGSSFEPAGEAGAQPGQGNSEAAPEAAPTPTVQSQHSQGASRSAPAAP